jgi:hypothetical protein
MRDSKSKYMYHVTCTRAREKIKEEWKREGEGFQGAQALLFIICSYLSLQCMQDHQG